MTDYSKQEEDWEKRINTIGQNGNTGEHYDSAPPIVPHNKDIVRKPSHYALLGGVEAKHVIASSMTKEQWEGYCLGNILKYRLRAGNKGDPAICIAKADEYLRIFNELKHLCKE